VYGYGRSYLGVVLPKVRFSLVLFLRKEILHLSDSDRDYSRESIPPESQKLGIRDKGYVPRVLLYVCFGLLDAMWQTTSYWLIGAMSNSPQRLAHFIGFCKSPSSHCPSSLGPVNGSLRRRKQADFREFIFRQIDAICWCCWGLESGWSWCPVSSLPLRSFSLLILVMAVERYLNIFYSTWGLLLGGLVFALPMMHMRIKDYTTDEPDEYDDGYSSSSVPPRSGTWEE